jgi:hypothetical protein
MATHESARKCKVFISSAIVMMQAAKRVHVRLDMLTRAARASPDGISGRSAPDRASFRHARARE